MTEDRRAVGVPLPPERYEFLRGMFFGLLMASLLVGFMAAGRLSQNPIVVIDAVIARGVTIDPRIERLAPEQRRSLLCVALNVLMEANGEPNAGQLGVAWVTRTRSEERDLSPCDVVFERSGAAQFTWSAYPLSRIVRTVAANQETFAEAQDWAWKALVENVPDPTKGANHFWGHHAIKPPAWSRNATPGSRVVLGRHTFIRIPHRRAPWAFRN